jgi:hypothetical protein
MKVIATIKAAGLRRLNALPGDKRYDTHRHQSFIGSKAEVKAVLKACKAAGHVPYNPPYLVAGAMRVDFDGNCYLTAFEGHVTYCMPKAHKTYSGSLYD